MLADMGSGPTKELILARAGEILAADGLQGLSMRRLAAAVGASTIVIYTHFANKQELLDELYRQGFERLEQALERVAPAADPIDHVADLGRAYHRFAVANPTHYQAMFGTLRQGFDPSPGSRAQALRSFAVLRSAVRAIDPWRADERAAVLWSTLHGLVGLELLGYWGAAGEARLEDAIAMLRTGLIDH